MPPINQQRPGMPMTPQAPQLPLGFLMNQQPQTPSTGGGLPLGDIGSLLKILQGVTGSGESPMGGGDLGTSQNLGLLARGPQSLSPDNIGGLLGGGMNTQFATPGMLQLMQGMGL